MSVTTNENSFKKHIYSVSEITGDLKSLLEDNFPSLWIRGEISNFRVYGSGHAYFTLKDEKAQISAVIFRMSARTLKFDPHDGMAVIAFGRLSLFESRGQYQIIISHLEPDGLGALQAAFEQLKAKLEAEGIFSSSRKRALPPHPQVIGVVTSEHGAVFHDIVNVLSRRHPGLTIRLFPVRVQGEGAEEEITSAINFFSQTKMADVLIVGRGGGSLEDLWAFNSEKVARAVALCSLPVISAVGHETDFTICDFAADVRAPTPSAAAELCAPLKKNIMEHVNSLAQKLHHHMHTSIKSHLNQIRLLKKALPRPEQILDRIQLKLGDFEDRLFQSMQIRLREQKMQVLSLKLQLQNPLEHVKRRQLQLNQLQKQLSFLIKRRMEKYFSDVSYIKKNLNLLSPLQILGRGYVLVQTKNGKLITEKTQVESGLESEVIFHDGRANIIFR